MHIIIRCFVGSRMIALWRCCQSSKSTFRRSLMTSTWWFDLTILPSSSHTCSMGFRCVDTVEHRKRLTLFCYNLLHVRLVLYMCGVHKLEHGFSFRRYMIVCTWTLKRLAVTVADRKRLRRCINGRHDQYVGLLHEHNRVYGSPWHVQLF